MIGKLDLGIEIANNILPLAQNDTDILKINLEIVYILWYKGSHIDADEIMKKLEPIIERYDKTDDIAVLKLIGTYYHLLNSIKYIWLTYVGSRKYLLRAIEIREKIGDLKNLAISYNNLGVSYKYTNEPQNAIEQFEKAIHIYEKLSNNTDIALALGNLFDVNWNIGDHQKIVTIISRLEKICKKNQDNDLISLYYNYYQAFYLKTKNNFSDWIKAEKLLLGIVEGDIIHPQYFTNSIFLLCEMYIEEMRVMDNVSILEQIHSLINKLLNHAFSQNQIADLLRAKILQSQYLILIGKVEDAKKLLLEINKEAIDHGEKLLSSIIDVELDRVLEHEDNLTAMQNAHVYEKLRIINFKGVLQRFIDKKEIITEVDELPIMMLLINNSGVEIFSKIFDETIDKNVLLRFNHAINNFIYNTTKEITGYIERMNVDSHVITVKKFEHYFFAYVFYGRSNLAIKRINRMYYELNEELSEITSMENIIVIKEYQQELFSIAIGKVFEDILI